MDLIDKGVDSINAGKIDEGIDLYTKAINRNPRIQLAYYNRGNAYQLLKKYPQALTDFNMAIKLMTVNGGIVWKNPDIDQSIEAAGQVPYEDVLYLRAIVKGELDSLNSAFSDFEYLVEKNYTEKSNCLLWQGIIFGEIGNRSKACEYFEKAKLSATNETELKIAQENINNNCKTDSNNR